jgi:nitroreductase
MDAIKAIITRRSIRKFKKEPISEVLINELLEAGMYAPSSGNQQPWHFIVVTNKRILNAIPSFHPHSKMLKEAPLGILVCCDKFLEINKDMGVQDCSAATENILIAANAKGLGAVWLGIHPRKERENGMRRLLKIPENVIPISFISIGYPNEKKTIEERFKNSRVHYNKW